MNDAFGAISDPIIRMYANEVEQNLLNLEPRALEALHSARKSLQGNGRLHPETKDEAYGWYNRAENSLINLRYTIGPDVAAEFNLVKQAQHELSGSLDFFRSSRRHFHRTTRVDSRLNDLRGTLAATGAQVDLLEKALIDNDEGSKKRIYELVVGEKLNQLDAPYLFNIVNHIINLLASSEERPSEVGIEALGLLTKEATDLYEHLLPTNIDRRLLVALQEYIGALTERNFSPIKTDLFSNKLRSYLVEFKDELPGFAIAEISALLLSQEQVLRQFPIWRSFENDASQFSPTNEVLKQQRELLEQIGKETRQTEGIASDQVLSALERLEEASETSIKSTAKLGVWRSAENFIKVNVKHLIDITKNWGSAASFNQRRYLKYLERLIPSLKLFVSVNDKYAWLLPVITWLEQTIKAIK